MTDLDRPRTAEQIAALPIGPQFGVEEFTLTEEDRKNGYIAVHGKQINIAVGCNKVLIPVAPDVVATYADESDIIGYIDEDGISWTLGRYADGRWFRQRS